MLVTVGIGGGFGYTGQRVIVEGYAFTNSLASYDSFNPGRFFTETRSIRTRRARLVRARLRAEQPRRHRPSRSTSPPTSRPPCAARNRSSRKSRSTSRSSLGGTNLYLLGNGYAPVLTVRDADGKVVWSQPTPFLPLDANLGSTCVIKVPDGLDQQIGMIGFLYPTTGTLGSGALASSIPT